MLSGTALILFHATAAASAAPPPTPPGTCGYAGPSRETICALRLTMPEDRDLRPEAFFFEPSKVLFLPHALQGDSSQSGSQEALALEVEFNETIFPYQNRASPRDRHYGGLTTAVGITPMYRVRIWKEQSAPVRVPSFMPKGTVQVHYLGPRRLGEQWSSHVPMTTAMVTIGHHSNGQDGCLYANADSVGYPLDACPDAPDEVRINRLNGSFSTNYVQASLFHTRFILPSTVKEGDRQRARATLWTNERRAALAFFGGATFEYNFPFDTFGGAIEEAARPIYGMSRLRLMLGFRRYPDGSRIKPQLRLTAWAEVTNKSQESADCGVPGAAGYWGARCAPSFNWGADLNVGLGSKIDYLGLYGRFYRGQDYYNLSFTHMKANEFQIGIAFTPGRSRGPSFPTIDRRVIDEEAKCLAAGQGSAYRKFVRKNALLGLDKGAAAMVPPTCVVAVNRAHNDSTEQGIH